MNKKDSSKGEEIKKESKEEVKEEDKGEENTRKRKHDEQDEFWNSQHEWKVVSWKLHSSSGVHTLDGLMKMIVSIPEATATGKETFNPLKDG
ncbi:hypothetical protein Tco_0608493 [Tanacetum coccineum]